VLHTRFTDLFGLDHPLMSAPMAMHSGGTVAAAVSAAGALGAFGGVHPEGPGWVEAQAALVRERTDRPFAIGFITSFLPAFERHFEVALEHADAIALSFGDPGEWAGRVKDAGLPLICQVQTFADADLAVAAGADVVVVQGNEAGGHTGTMTLLPFLVAVSERHPDVPLLAAGGVGDGRSLAAAMLAGADGAWLGTAFLATDEAVEINDALKSAVVASDGGDTVYSHVFDILSGAPWPAGIGHRTGRDATTDEWADREADLRAQRESVTADEPKYYGQSAAFVSGVRPAADVVRSISTDAEQVLRERPARLLAR
jgi:nitronate monooxygenase